MKFGKRQKFSCEIKGNEVEGRLQVEEGQVYLCQNAYDGIKCRDKLGYDYSWSIGKGILEGIRDAGVTNLKLDPLTLDDIQVGDEIEKYYKYAVLARIDNKVWLSSSRESDGIATIEYLKECGYTVVQPEPEVKELTLNEVIKELGYDIKIVKKDN